MIKYIQKKSIRFENIEKILQESLLKNHFANNGPAKVRLEKTLELFLEIQDDKRVVVFNNGTTAAHALMFFYEQRKNNFKWVTPSFTFPSVSCSKNNVSILDISLETFTLDMSDNLLEYDGIIITNLFGSYVDIESWSKFCNDNNIVLIFDNASSPMSISGGKNICNFGNSSFGSLHHTKPIGFGEGGFAVIPAEFYEELNSISNFGFLDKNRIYKKNSSNFKMPDTSAAFIIDHINNFSKEKYLESQNYYIENLKDNLGFNLFNYKDGTVYGNLPILFVKKTDINFFREKRIEANKYYNPLLKTQNASIVYDKIINFPLHSSLEKREMDKIIKTIIEYGSLDG